MEGRLDEFASLPIFAGVPKEKIGCLLETYGARVQQYAKNETIYANDSKAGSIGIILSGNALMYETSIMGTQNIYDEMGGGDVIGALSAAAGIPRVLGSVAAASDMDVLWFEYDRLLAAGKQATIPHQRVLGNLLAMVAKKGAALFNKTRCLSQRSIYDKLLAYFSSQAPEGVQFTIPFSRQQLADYLSVDRSAMTVQLGRMKKEGVLEIDKKRFIWHKAAD